MTAPPNSRACFSTLGCPGATFEEVVSLAKRFQIPFLELRVLENRLDLPDLLKNFPGGWKGVRETLRARDLSVRVLGTSFKLISDGPVSRGELLSFGELAEALNVPYLRIFGGGAWGDRLEEKDYVRAAETLKEWQVLRKERGWRVDVLIETHDALSAASACVPLLEFTDARFIWDTHHTWRLGGESPRESWDLIGSRVRHVHIKDSVGVPSARHPYTYVMMGEGEMPLRETFAVLEGAEYEGAISLEWEKQWHPYLPTLEEALRAMPEFNVQTA